MKTDKLILVEHFCRSSQIAISFIESLNDFQLIEITVFENNSYLEIEQLKEVERIHYFHTQLNINFEGIETIKNLLEQIDGLQQELKEVKNKLAILESI